MFPSVPAVIPKGSAPAGTRYWVIWPEGVILPIRPPAKDLFQEWDHARQLAPRLMVVRESKQEPDLDVLDKLPHTLDEPAGGPSAFRQLLFEFIPHGQVLALAHRNR